MKKPRTTKRMSAKAFRDALDQLGLTVAGKGTAAALGIGIRQVQRLYHGDSPVPPPVAKLIGLYLRYGLKKRDTASD